MNNKQLQYALELAKTLNFSVVAKKLGISQPALSKHISNLEKELEAELFDRKTNPITLTAAGKYFFKKAEDILYREEQLYNSMQDFKTEKRGDLTIGISPFRSLYLLHDMCKKVKEKYPDVKIVFCEDSSENLRQNATDGKYDFAIVNLPVNESLLNVVPLEQDKLVIAVPNTMLNLIESPSKSNLSKIDFRNCKNLPFIVVGQNQEMRILFEKMCYSADIAPKIAMEVVGLTTAWKMAREGLGAAVLPLQFIKSMGESNLKFFIPDCDMNVRQPAIITRHGQYLSEFARYAIEILKNN